jgi:phosphoribosylformimino-5-aminoimidazole carboxamide ribotide isomerase
MFVIPSIDLERGRVVQRVQGRGGTGLRVPVDPIECARRWRTLGARRLHVVDLDAAEGHDRQLALLHDVVRSGDGPVQVGGGIRSIEDVRATLAGGADRVVLSTSVWEVPGWGESAAQQFGDQVGFGLDVRAERLLVRGWQKDGPTLELALEVVRRSKVRWIVYTDVLREGGGSGIEMAAIRRLRSQFDGELLVAGGIASRAELVDLAEAGVDGAIVGRSLYDGTLRPAIVDEEFP